MRYVKGWKEEDLVNNGKLHAPGAGDLFYLSSFLPLSTDRWPVTVAVEGKWSNRRENQWYSITERRAFWECELISVANFIYHHCVLSSLIWIECKKADFAILGKITNLSGHQKSNFWELWLRTCACVCYMLHLHAFDVQISKRIIWCT